jgi:hypothetical protein
MGKFFDEIPSFLFPWIEQQEVFWVASAPLNADGHVNVSPKGLRGSFHIINANKVWYQDISGSGIETISHLRENGRITILFNAFQGPPRITRLFGKGTVHEFGTPEYNALIPISDRKPGSRSAIIIDIHKVGTSCGYAVPYYTFQGHRTKLLDYYDKKESADRAAGAECPSDDGLKAYWALKNLKSIDGLDGLSNAHKSDVIPQSVYDKAKEGRKEQNGVGSIGAYWNRGDLKFVAGLSLGLVMSATYVRLGGVL